MNIISQLNNDVQFKNSSGMFNDEHHIKMDSYVAHTAYFDDYSNWGSYWRRLVVAPTGGGSEAKDLRAYSDFCLRVFEEMAMMQFLLDTASN